MPLEYLPYCVQYDLFINWSGWEIRPYSRLNELGYLCALLCFVPNATVSLVSNTVTNNFIPVVNSAIPEVLVQFSDDLRGLIARHRVVHHIKEVQQLTQPWLRVDCYFLSQRSASDPARHSYHLKHHSISVNVTTVEPLISDLVHREFSPLKLVLSSVTTATQLLPPLCAWILIAADNTTWSLFTFFLAQTLPLCACCGWQAFDRDYDTTTLGEIPIYGFLGMHLINKFVLNVFFK